MKQNAGFSRGGAGGSCANGAGKTTLLNAVAGCCPRPARFAYRGSELAGLPPHRIDPNPASRAAGAALSSGECNAISSCQYCDKLSVFLVSCGMGALQH